MRNKILILTTLAMLSFSAGGMALITFANGSQVTLKANAEFQIESLTILAAKNAGDYKLRLNTGKLRAIVENLGSDSSFSIKTPTAVTTAKETVYYLHVQELASEEVLEKINSAGDLRGSLTVCADGGFRPPASAKAMLVTELFAEAGGVVYANPISGKYYAVNAGQESGSYENGNIDLPHDIPPDKQLEWTEGWEAILDAEGYQEPGRGLDFSINAGGAEDVENLFRQGSRTMMADYDLSANAALASKNAAAAADEILADIISFEKRREKDTVRQEIHAKLLERSDLRNEIREIIEENELRRYVLSEDFGRRDDYKNLRIADISDALRVSMAEGSMNIDSNNLEMVFSSSVFQYGAIDLIYVPMMNMDWKDNNHIPDYSL